MNSKDYLNPTSSVVLAHGYGTTNKHSDKKVINLQKPGQITISFATYTFITKLDNKISTIMLEVAVNGVVQEVELTKGVQKVSFTFSAVSGAN